MNNIQALADPNTIGASFPDLSTFLSWQTAIKVADGLPLYDEEMPLFQRCTGREKPPTTPAKEVYFIVGRRGGKGRITAAKASYLAAFRDYSKILAPGEEGLLPIIASDREQARIVLNYTRDIFLQSPILRRMVLKDDLTWEIPLKNHVTIRVMTCSKAAIRGYTLVGAVLEETAHWASEGANPDREIMRALRPGRLTTKGPLIVISTPYRRVGILWEAYKKHWAQDESSILVWLADSLTMNPTLDAAEIEEEIKNDPESGRTEFYCEFRSDLEDFLPPEAIEAVVIPGRYELPPLHNLQYTAFADFSGGRSDASCLAIGHREGGKVVMDVCRRWKSPHDPSIVTAELCEVLKKYRISRLTADRYSGGWAESELCKHGIRYEASPADKSSLYLSFLPMVLSGQVELLDNKTLFNELRGLERRVRRGGRDLIDHPMGKNYHDDTANVAAGLSVLIGTRPLLYSTSTEFLI